MATLALVAYHLTRPEEIAPTLRQLGQRHVGYGVQPEDYGQVGEALLWALFWELGDAFTVEREGYRLGAVPAGLVGERLQINAGRGASSDAWSS